MFQAWGSNKVKLYIKIYPPTEQRSTCAQEWHSVSTAEVFHNHFAESWRCCGRGAVTFLFCRHPLSAAVVTFPFFHSSHCNADLKLCSVYGNYWRSLTLPHMRVFSIALFCCPSQSHSCSRLYQITAWLFFFLLTAGWTSLQCRSLLYKTSSYLTTFQF